MRSRFRSQSAMEYLMTYGWAILIIAVVLGILFQLGVFSGGNFAPRAQAGTCQVERTAAGTALAGQCGGTPPEYVAQFYNGNFLEASSTFNNPIGESVSFWFYVPSTAQQTGLVSFGNYYPGDSWGAGLGGFNPVCTSNSILAMIDGPNEATFCTTTEVDSGIWNNLVFTTDQSQTTHVYLNGVQVSSYGGGILSRASWNMYVGTTPVGWADLNGGYITNIQIYNVSLSLGEVQALYAEGIGGAPIRPTNLTGWWPLNGNANDYSGKGNNAVSGCSCNSGVHWTSSYPSPT